MGPAEAEALGPVVIPKKKLQNCSFCVALPLWSSCQGSGRKVRQKNP